MGKTWEQGYVSLHDPLCVEKEMAATILPSEVCQTTDDCPVIYDHYNNCIMKKVFLLTYHQLLQHSPHKRLPLSEVLKHPWILHNAERLPKGAPQPPPSSSGGSSSCTSTQKSGTRQWLIYHNSNMFVCLFVCLFNTQLLCLCITEQTWRFHSQASLGTCLYVGTQYAGLLCEAVSTK